MKNRKLRILVFIVLLIVPLQSVFCINHTGNANFLDDPYEGEGRVVKSAANIGMACGFIGGGIVGGVVGVLFLHPIEGAFFTGVTAGYCGGWVAGFPFYVTKKVLYDFPKLLFRKKNKQYEEELGINNIEINQLEYKKLSKDEAWKADNPIYVQMLDKKNFKYALLDAASYSKFNIAKELLRKGANVNIRDDSKFTPLHKAAKSGNAKITKLLIYYGADLDARGGEDVEGGNYYFSPLELSAEKGHLEVVRLLVENGANINSKNVYDETPLHKACGYYENYEVIKYLIEKGAKINTKSNKSLMNTPLQRAVTGVGGQNGGGYKIVKLLLENGADMNIKDRYKRSAPEKALCSGRFDMLKLFLMDYGYNVRIINRDLQTPLHIAVIKKDVEFVKFLIDKGARLDKTNKSGENPFDIALKLKNNDEIISILSEAGCKLSNK